MIILPDAHTIAHRERADKAQGRNVGVQLPSKPLVAYWMLFKPIGQLYTVAGEPWAQLVTGFRNSPEQEGRRGSCVWRLRFALASKIEAPRQLSPLMHASDLS